MVILLDEEEVNFEHYSSQRRSASPREVAVQDLSQYLSDLGGHPAGMGGFSNVYKCSLASDDVAVKVIRQWASNKTDDRTMRKVLAEVNAWARLSHPNVLELFGICYVRGTPWPCPVSPWKNLGKINDFIRDRPETDLLSIAHGIAIGLHHLHSKGVVHGDLRGSNILTSDDGSPCLADFGLAKIKDCINEETATTTTMCGSVRWMAHEFFRHTSEGYFGVPTRTKESDVWSFGMTLLELLTGRFPYADDRMDPSVLLRIGRGELPDIPDVQHERWRPLTDFMHILCHYCWSLVPGERPTMQFIIASIMDYMQNQSGPSGSHVLPKIESNVETASPRAGTPNATQSRSGSGYTCPVTTPASDLSSPNAAASSSRIEMSRGRPGSGGSVYQPLQSSSSRFFVKNEDELERNNLWRRNSVDSIAGSSDTTTESSSTYSLHSTEPQSFPPRSPQPHSISYISALNMYLQATKQVIRHEEWTMGPDHNRRWQITYFFNGQNYGQGEAYTKQSAKEQAAKQVYERLEHEAMTRGPSLPFVLNHLKVAGLQGRVEWNTMYRFGSNDLPSWTCELSMDGSIISRGRGVSKDDAKEDASKHAASVLFQGR